MPTLLDNEDTRTLYARRAGVQQRQKYGKRLEFRPPMTQKLQRKIFNQSETNLDKSKSHSATELTGLRSLSRERLELPGLRTRARDKRQSQAPARALQNARRLYRIVKPLAPTRYPTNDQDRERCVGPEFVVRSSQPILQLDLASGMSLALLNYCSKLAFICHYSIWLSLF